MTDTAQDAATAARQTRDRKIQEALNAYWADARLARVVMPTTGGALRSSNLRHSQLALTACLAHLDELTRLIAQRDGMPVSDGPDTGERRYG